MSAAEWARFEAIVAAGRYMTIATAGPDGTPWASPVWFASADAREFLWISKPGARHSRNLAARPRVAIAIFDSRQPPGTGAGVYIAADAGLVPDEALDDAVATYSRISQRAGAGPLARSDVEADAPHRMYRAVALERYVLSSRDERIAVG
ncbi:MAG TPA: pyridoxamine 5'-phosphate oxidase family protein [Gaiellales bacterium]|nr:pyridoxamine 5'-phosphate oxidase family protein [Gaiellales bacterium]